MRQRVKGRKLNRTSSHRRAMFRNMLTSLFEHKRIHTTEAKAKELRPIAEKVLTRAIKAVRREEQGQISDGAKHDLNTRRLIGSYLMNKSVVDILFDEIVPEIGERQGGYTRVVKTGIRRGDAGRAALIELVDYNTELVETGTKKKKKSQPSTPKKKVSEEVTETAEEVVEVQETDTEVVSGEEANDEVASEPAVSEPEASEPEASEPNEKVKDDKEDNKSE